MIEKSLRSNLENRDRYTDQIVYHLIFKNAFYSMECFVDGCTDNNKYSYIEDITDDEGEAETFMKLMAHGRVHPLHIRDMAEDYFR